jgi:microcystin-dependent protein
MATEYTRLIIRQGSESERQNVIFKTGEPAYTTNYKRLFVGDGRTPGGVITGMKFLGFGEFDEFSNAVSNVFPGYTGDIMFENGSGILYVLSGGDFRDKRNYFAINKTPTPDRVTLIDIDGRLSIIPRSLNFSYFGSYSIGRGLQQRPGNDLILELKGTGEGLEFDDNESIRIREFGITNNMLAPMTKDSVKAAIGDDQARDVGLGEFSRALISFLSRSGGGSVGVPIGTIIDYGGASPPPGYLICNGEEYKTSDYPELANVVRSTWGVGTISSFVVPNLMGRTTLGSGSNYFAPTSGINTIPGSYGGTAEVELQRQQLPRHHHEFKISQPGYSANPAFSGNDSFLLRGVTDGGPDVGIFDSILGVAHTNIQPSAVVMKCIKAL